MSLAEFPETGAPAPGFSPFFISLAELAKENSRRHTRAVILKFFVERPDFTKSLMATKKQLSIIVNKKQRT